MARDGCHPHRIVITVVDSVCVPSIVGAISFYFDDNNITNKIVTLLVNIHSTDSSNDDESQIIKARDEFVALSQTLATRSSAGKVFISSMKDAVKFRDEFVRFESKVADCLSSSSSLPLAYTSKRDLMLGDWTFIATASVTSRLFTRRTAHDADETRATTMSTKG